MNKTELERRVKDLELQLELERDKENPNPSMVSSCQEGLDRLQAELQEDK